MGNIFIIWGTGYEADKLMKWLSVVNRMAEEFFGEKACEIAWFLDSNVQKTQELFCGSKVRLPETIWHENATTIIVAVAKNEEIVSKLEQHGYHRMDNYLTLEDFYGWLWCDSKLTWRLIEALVPGNDFVSGLREKILPQDMPTRFEELYRKLCVSCAERDCADQLESLQDMLVLSVLLADCDWPDKEAMGEKLQDMVGIARFVNLLESIFKDRTDNAAQWMSHTSKKVSKRALPRTIALYYTRYYNGGTERVISKLLQIFQANGYRLVLITNEIKENMEYPLPEGVSRVLLGYAGGRQARCERLLHAIELYEVDVFCSHAYSGNILYDVFCVQQAGVPVVMEFHNNFSFITNVLGGKALILGQRVDALVTLSRVDEMFWRLQGCDSIYVPNPVDPLEEQMTEPESCTILWLQRIDQLQKQVFELPIIFEYVLQVLPEARLQIVGAADKPEIEEQLRQMFDERGLTDHVDFMGFHRNVEKYYRKATVMLMTSAFEGFPMTIAESKRYGTPLVLYELPYLELLRDGRGYIAVPQHGHREAAEALLSVLRDREWRNKLSQEAKESLADFSQMDIMAAWEKVWAIARLPKKMELTDEQKTFMEIERLLLQLAKSISFPSFVEKGNKMEYVIYGAGDNGKKLLKKWGRDHEFSGFYDRYKSGNCLGVQIRHFQDGDRKKSVLISLSDKRQALEAYNDLRIAGYKELYWYRENPYADIDDFQAQIVDMRDWGDSVLLQAEMHLSDCCNLNCRGCTHFSPLFHKVDIDKESALSDVRQLSRKVSHIIDFYLLGGEPFLNNEVSDYVRSIRAILPHTRLFIVTNGLLIPRLPKEILTCLHDEQVIVSISEYEPTHQQIEDITACLDEAGVIYQLRPYDDKQVFNIPLEIVPSGKYPFKCISQDCVNIYKGGVSRCPTLMYLYKFNEAFNENLPTAGILRLDDCPDGKELIKKLHEVVPLCQHCIEKSIPWSKCKVVPQLDDFAVI